MALMKLGNKKGIEYFIVNLIHMHIHQKWF